MSPAAGQGVAWIDSRWGSPSDLSLPLSDRGLQLADGLFETVLILDGRPRLLAEHLNRWRGSAELLGMARPPEVSWLEPLIDEAIRRADLRGRCGALRLNWSRGSGGGRGLGTTADCRHRFWLTLQPHRLTFAPITVIISRRERRNALSQLSRCKTLAYGQAIQARREAEQAGAQEALLLNTHGELCCGSIANLLVLREGAWLTPTTRSGCLPGVMRGRAVALGMAREAPLGSALRADDQALLINSLGCRPIERLDGQALEPAAKAEQLWRSLLDHPGEHGRRRWMCM